MIARGSWRWTPAQDIALYRRRRIDRAPFKQLAHEFNRSEPVVQQRFHFLERLNAEAHADILAQHLEEEAQLLEKALNESRQRDWAWE